MQSLSYLMCLHVHSVSNQFQLVFYSLLWELWHAIFAFLYDFLFACILGHEHQAWGVVGSLRNPSAVVPSGWQRWSFRKLSLPPIYSQLNILYVLLFAYVFVSVVTHLNDYKSQLGSRVTNLLLAGQCAIFKNRESNRVIVCNWIFGSLASISFQTPSMIFQPMKRAWDALVLHQFVLSNKFDVWLSQHLSLSLLYSCRLSDSVRFFSPIYHSYIHNHNVIYFAKHQDKTNQKYHQKCNERHEARRHAQPESILLWSSCRASSVCISVILQRFWHAVRDKILQLFGKNCLEDRDQHTGVKYWASLKAIFNAGSFFNAMYSLSLLFYLHLSKYWLE